MHLSKKRKKIAYKKKIKAARLYATALGIYELTLNGEKVGDTYFAPGFTSYKHQLQYQTYDITRQLSDGENELCAIVAGGWAVGSFTYKRVNRYYADRQAFLVTRTSRTRENLKNWQRWLLSVFFGGMLIGFRVNSTA